MIALIVILVILAGGFGWAFWFDRSHQKTVVENPRDRPNRLADEARGQLDNARIFQGGTGR